MKPSNCFSRSVWASVALVLIVSRTVSAGQDAPALLPGVVDFAGRVSRDHWHLFGAQQRSELEQLNRKLRESQQSARRKSEESARQGAAERGTQAAGRLLELVTGCPKLIRVHLESDEPRFVPAGPIELPGDTGALLFEVVSPGDGIRFGTAASDLAHPQGEPSLLVVEAGTEGVTYSVAGLNGVARGLTTLIVEFRRPGRPAVRLPLEVRTPAPGRLKMMVLSDDTGEPTPAMVRLTWLTDGVARQPSNGIQFSPQFDRKGALTGARRANLPGPQSQQFWCVPGPFDMALPPGEWQIGVRRGIEHEVVFVNVTLRSGETVEKTVRPRRWVDMRQRGWWSGDDHVHCRILSDSDARNLMAWVKAEDVHLANVVKMGDINRTYFEQRGFGPSHRVVEGETVLVPGQECPRTDDQLGHTLAMNITSMVRNTNAYFLYDTVFDEVHAQGGLTGYAHLNSGIFHVNRDMSLNVPRGKVDFGEILQFNHLGTELYYDFLNLGCKLTASAGSDVPWGGTIGEARVYAYLGDTPFSADAWFTAFERGRTFTSSGPMVDFRLDGALPGDELAVTENRPLRVRARAWGEPRQMTRLTLEIVRHGDVIKSARSTDSENPEVTLEFEVNSENGFWIAARARTGQGTSAHTTPVYVVREGLRFWDYDQLEALLVKRAESLRQIEEMVAEARRLQDEGELGTNRYLRQLAQQADALLERVRLAREVYEELSQTAAREQELRTTDK